MTTRSGTCSLLRNARADQRRRHHVPYAHQLQAPHTIIIKCSSDALAQRADMATRVYALCICTAHWLRQRDGCTSSAAPQGS